MNKNSRRSWRTCKSYKCIEV